MSINFNDYDFYLALEGWQNNFLVNGNKKVAAELMTEVFINNSCKLDLSSKQPNDVELNLTSIPSCIEKLTSLTKLVLKGNKLTKLPTEIRHLSKLQKLDISDSQVTELPNGIGNLTQLSKLKANNNILKMLPGVGKLTQLKTLEVSENLLVSLPTAIGNLKQLQKLCINANMLSALPSEIGNLTQLQVLNVADNYLTNLPMEIGKLSQLQYLNLANNPLKSLPKEILKLNGSCEIELEGCSLPKVILNKLQNINSQSEGPVFNFNKVFEEHHVKTIEESLVSLHEIAARKYVPLKNLGDIHKENFEKWLSSLFLMRNFGNDNPLGKKLIASKILDYLTLANENREFRKRLNTAIIRIIEIYGDRIELSVVELNLHYQLFQINKKNLPKLAEFLKHMWAIGQLGKEVNEKLSKFPFFDKLDLYLGYLAGLANELNLPIDTLVVPFECIEALKAEDLQAAASKIKSNLNNQNLFYAHLVSRREWLNALKTEFKTEYEEIEKDKEIGLLLDGSNNQDIEDNFKKELMALTEKALSLYTLEHAQEFMRMLEESLDF